MPPDADVFADTTETPAVRGFLQRPATSSGDGLVLTHGAGGNCNAPLLVALAEKFAEQAGRCFAAICRFDNCDLTDRRAGMAAKIAMGCAGRCKF